MSKSIRNKDTAFFSFNQLSKESLISQQCTLKLDRREGGPELIIMFSDYDTTASKLSCDEIPLVQSFQPIRNELTFGVL